MKLRYLGTAAYEGIPALMCNCRVCRAARAAGGRDLRSRSQAIVDGTLLLDFPPDTQWHVMRFSLDWNALAACLITHEHSDHFYPEDMVMGRPDFCPESIRTDYYLPAAALRRLEREMADTGLADFGGRVGCHLVQPFSEFEVAGYRILPLAADHPSAQGPLFYAIERAGVRLLYAHDTGYFPEQTWEALRTFGRFDAVSLDCTGGLQTDWRGNHMCLKTGREVADRMIAEGMADGNTVFVANHFSHNGGGTYAQLCEAAEPYGFMIAYDGMEIEF